jgi:hypothetical protein
MPTKLNIVLIADVTEGVPEHGRMGVLGACSENGVLTTTLQDVERGFLNRVGVPDRGLEQIIDVAPVRKQRSIGNFDLFLGEPFQDGGADFM